MAEEQTLANTVAPVGSQARSTRAYRKLRDLIVHGRLAPGARIVESEVATRLDMSRTPVRSALQRLQQEGYIIATVDGRQSRTSIAPLTLEDARELFNIIGVLEGLAGRLASQLSPEVRNPLVGELDRLNAELGALYESRNPDANRRFENDTEFHRQYVEAASGSRLNALHASVKPQAERYIRLYIHLFTSEAGASLEEHEAIAAAISGGKAEASQRAVQTNWRNAAERMARLIEQAGERGTW